jgi:hypothetical protein
MTRVKGSFIGLPVLDGGNFTGTGGEVQIFFKFHTCVSFMITDLSDYDFGTDETIDRTTSNAYVIKGTVQAEVYNWMAMGHG